MRTVSFSAVSGLENRGRRRRSCLACDAHRLLPHRANRKIEAERIIDLIFLLHVRNAQCPLASLGDIPWLRSTRHEPGTLAASRTTLPFRSGKKSRPARCFLSGGLRRERGTARDRDCVSVAVSATAAKTGRFVPVRVAQSRPQHIEGTRTPRKTKGWRLRLSPRRSRVRAPSSPPFLSKSRDAESRY